MSEENKSHGQILKSSSIIGGASVINIVIGLFKIKVVAVLLGPAGIGLIGLLQNVMHLSSNVASMGVGTVGTRQVAEANAKKDQQAIASTRRALFLGTIILAVIGAFLVWLIREPLAIIFLSDKDKSSWVGWLAIGVALTVASGSQRALLNGMRRIGDLAKLSIYSSVFATILGIAAVWFWQEKGLLFFVISVPLATFLLGHFYVNKIPKVEINSISLLELKKQWNVLIRLGFAFMLAGLSITFGQLAVRTLVQGKLGFEALGLFESSWVISMTYIGFVLSAMGTDYYPRLTKVIDNHSATIRLVNEQTEVALLLSGPILLGMLTFSPWVLTLLYSSEFSQAAQILRWQILGDILKIMSWPLAFIMLASGAGKTYVLVESLGVVVFFFVTWSCIEYFKVEATGIGFLSMYIIYLTTVYFLANRRIGFKWSMTVLKYGIILITSAVLLIITSMYNELFGLILGLIFTAYISIKNLRLIVAMSGNKAIVRKIDKIISKLNFQRPK